MIRGAWQPDSRTPGAPPAYAGCRAVLATMHGKESVIVPSLRQALVGQFGCRAKLVGLVTHEVAGKLEALFGLHRRFGMLLRRSPIASSDAFLYGSVCRRRSRG